MLNLILKKVLLIIPSLIGVTLITFTLVHLIPGDPLQAILGVHQVSAEVHQEYMHKLGLDLPLWQQYFHYLGDLLHGDFGKSFHTNETFTKLLGEKFTATAELSLCAMMIALVLGLPAGIYAALNRGKFVDSALMTITLVGYSMPLFWFALMLVILFSVNLGITPVSGRLSSSLWIDTPTGFMLIDTLLSGEEGAFKDAVMHLVLPSFVLGTIPMAVFARMTRAAMVEVLSEEYITVALSYGISPTRVVMTHALRNAMIPVITVIGMSLAGLFAGAVLTETVFSWPGMGKWIVDSLAKRDYIIIQSGILVIAMIYIVTNLIVDILYGVFDPRVRHVKGK